MNKQYQSQKQSKQRLDDYFEEKKSNPTFDWKKYIKRVCQIGLGIALFGYISNAVLYHSFNVQTILNEQPTAQERYVTKNETITQTDGILDSTLSNEVEINGDVYALPCSLKYFTDNGWEIGEYSDDLNKKITSEDYAYVYLEKGPTEISVNIQAPEGESVLVGNGLVTSIYPYFDDGLDFKISGGLYKGMSEDELEELLDKNDWFYSVDKVEDGKYYSIIYEKDDFPYRITYNLDSTDGVITSISIYSYYVNY